MSKVIRTIFGYLKFDVLPTLEYPCEHCSYFECKKWGLKSFLKKHYANEDMIAYKDCLKRKREELKELIAVLRNPIFRKYANESCEKCGTKMFWRDMHLHSEWEKKETKRYKDSREVKIFRLCPKCNRNYSARKTALFEGFEKNLRKSK
jgi:hypothetical protein